ncbi:hypothetical protein CVT91_10880 [Candidatus Atribacteria bacterium HGW-Atribacteria-1]|nr:MAG: hypothetical protein CVT91_10880 [Candidatus Atribacteria bacterium HGW-Atribacteria-1]
MKKLLLVLLVVTLASFLLVGCLGTGIVVDEEEEDDTVVTTVEVEIADSVELGGKLYVSADTHDIKITFPTPVVGNVVAYLGSCSGDYPVKGLLDDFLLLYGETIVLFPNADRTVWEGSADFADLGPCCATYLFISAGECENDVCLQFPIIVDSVGPYAQIKASIIACPCAGGDQLKLTSAWTGTTAGCVTPAGCCDDYCSGLAGWTLDIYDEDPFDDCCVPDPCVTAYKSCIGTACPVECLTECDEDFFVATEDWEDSDDNKDYYVIVTMTDEVDNSTTYYGVLVVDTDSIVSFHDYVVDSVTCVWTECDDTDDILGDCYGVPCARPQ